MKSQIKKQEVLDIPPFLRTGSASIIPAMSLLMRNSAVCFVIVRSTIWRTAEALIPIRKKAQRTVKTALSLMTEITMAK